MRMQAEATIPRIKNMEIVSRRNYAKWRHLQERWVEENQFTFFS